MERLSTPEILEREIASCTSSFNDKLSGKGGKRAVLICGGTGCIANGSEDLVEEFRRLIKEKGLDYRVTCNHVGWSRSSPKIPSTGR